MEAAGGWWCLSLMVLYLQMSHSLQLQNIKDNPGILPVKLGQAYRQEDKWTVIKVLDLNDIKETLKFNVNKFLEFDKLVDVNKPFSHEFYNIRLHAYDLYNITINKFRQLVPSSRFKRGILNPLGSLIKVVTGNLDHEDAIKYDKLISELKGNQIHTEKKLIIVSKMLDGLINSTETLHNNTLILDERLKRIEKIVKYIASKENNSVYNTYMLSLFKLFIGNFRTIYLTISEIETVLALSKVSVLHQSIINSDEFLKILESVAKYDNLVYPVNLNNLIKIEKTIVVKSYMKENQITFILEIPLIDGNIYNYFKIYSLPMFKPSTNLTYVIIPKYPYLLAKGPKYHPINSPCDELAPGQFLCKENDQVIYPERTCVEQLMRFHSNLTLCRVYPVYVEDIKIQRIDPANWIVYTRSSQILTEKCNDDTIKRQIQGTYLISNAEDCELYIENFKLNRRRSIAADFHFKVTPVIGLPKPDFLKMNVTTELSKVDIKGVSLDNLKHLSNVLNSERFNSDISESEIIDTRSVSLATIFLYVILIISIITIIIWKFKVFNFTRNHQDSKSSDDFVLEEGGVMPPLARRTVTVHAA
ncbi:uncharacterized protein LOC126375481 [Pectinophora gossypiella]|uniref:uncharacterized protein LOC126375481 n=1 Tax=Pectinophora gossypiella TaxID=13191 RepID=UPI00214F0EB8|nr:uncharacterized protein LOC126375481 [Pectinophora gossypiella]